VFASQAGTPMQARNVSRRGLERAVERAGLNGDDRPWLTPHQLRHGYASALIAEGADPVSVSRQLGHADVSITLRVYSHEFDTVWNADRTRERLAAAFSGTGLETVAGERWRTEGP
jgi:integrase